MNRKIFRKSIKQLIAIFLCLTMIWTGAELFTVAAATPNNPEPKKTGENESLEDQLSTFLNEKINTQDAVAIHDMEEFADNEVALELNDGTISVYIFSEPIKYEDENGETKFKDVTIVKQNDPAVVREGFEYTNGDNDFSIDFSENVDTGVKISSENSEVSLVPVQSEKLDKLDGEVKEIVNTDNNTEDVFSYEGVFGEGSRIEYSPQLNGLKENIILEKYTGQNTFDFVLNTHGDIAELVDGQIVEIKDRETGEVVNTLLPLFAYDSFGNGEYSTDPAHYTEDCVYTLTEQGDDSYKLTVTVSEEWLTAPTTVYPVTIDPTITNNYTGMDCALYSAKPDEVFSTGYQTNNTGYSKDYGKGRAMFKFGMPTDIPTGAVIVGAKYYFRETTAKSDATYVGAFMINSVANGWSHLVATWNKYSTAYDENEYLDRKIINSASTDVSGSPYWYKFDIVTAVQKWINGTNANRGVMLVSDSEGTTASWRAWASIRHGTSSFKSYANIMYEKDTTVPVINSVTGNPTEWTNKDVTLTINATDNVGVKEYSFDNGSTWQTGKTKTYSANTSNIKIKVRDYAGNESAVTTVNITKIDKTVPATITSVTVSPTSWTNGNITVTHTAASSLSPITKYQYAISTSSTTAPTAFTDLPSPTALTHVLTSPTTGTQYVWVRAVNVAGNSAAKCSSAPYMRNATIPGTITSVTVSPTSWTNGNITVTHTAASSLSPITKYQYAISTSNTTAPTTFTDLPSPTALSHTLTSPIEGTQYVWVRAVNVAGNSTAKCSSTPYKRDATPPEVPATLAFIDDPVVPGNKKLVWSGVTDKLSGVAKLEYKLPNGTYILIPASAGIASGSYSFPCAASVTEADFRITDNANNSQTIDTDLIVDVPGNFVAKAMVSMSTRLTWEGNAATGITYDIYASDTSNGTYNKIAQDRTGNYWFDYTLRQGTRYYKVKARMFINGMWKESLFTPVQSATSVNLTIAGSYIGVRAHEQLLSFEITSGAGMVHPISGNLYYSASDASTNSAVEPVSFTRSYNSLGNYSTGLGNNWDHSLNIMLLKQYDTDGNEGILFKSGDGGLNLFKKNADGSYTRPAGLYAWLTQGSNGNYILTFKDQTKYFFNKSNQLEEIVTRFGKKTVFTYRPDGNLIKVTNPVGDELTIAYLEQTGKTDMIASVTAAGVTTKYEYDSNGYLKESYKENEGERQSEKYSYTNGKLTTITNANGKSYTIAYSGDKASAVTNPENQVYHVTYSKDASGNYIVAGSFSGKITQQYYTESMKLFAVAENGRTTQYEYDADYNVTKVTTPAGKVSQSTYDGRGNILTSTEPGGLTTYYQYDDGKDVPKKVDAPHNGNVRHVTVNTYNGYDQVLTTYVVGSRQKTWSAYDANGNLIQTVQVTGDGAEALASYTQATGSGYYVQETQYTYDAKNRLEFTTQIGETFNRVTEQKYDDETNQVVAQSDGEIESTFKYDDVGQMVESETKDDDIIEVTETAKYDAMGNVVEQTTFSETVTTTTTTKYDALGRVIETVDESGLITQTAYTNKPDGGSYTVTTQTKGGDIQNKTLSVCDKWGNETLSGPIALNGETGVRVEEGFRLLSYTESTYDADGKETESQDESGVTTKSTYDARDRLTEQTMSKGDESETTSTTYDDAGNTLTETAADGKVTTNIYDILSRTLSTTLSKGSNSLCTDTNEYDRVVNGQLVETATDAKKRPISRYTNSLGDLVKETIGTKTTVNVYNADGKMLSSTLTDTAYPNESSVVTYEYTGSLNTKKTYAPGHFVEYTYDDQGKVSKETVTKGAWSHTTAYTYDNATGKVVSMTRNGDTISYTYTPAGNLETITYGTGDVVKYEYNSDDKVMLTRHNNVPIQKYEYNKAGLLVNVKAYDGQGNEYVSEARSYDWKGNVASKTYYDRQGNEREKYDISYEYDQIVSEICTVSYTGTPVITAKEYEYDWLDRLTLETADGKTTSYTYDEVSNRLSMDDGTDRYTYTYNDSDQLLDVKRNNLLSQSYVYDLPGNQISKTEGDVTTEYVFDAANRLEKVMQNNDTLGEYTYDATGQRLSKTVDSLTTKYYYDGINLLYTKEDDLVSEINLFDTNGDIIQSVRSNDKYVYRTDIRESISNILDAEENVVQTHTYDAYGNTTASNTTFKNILAYTGAVIDLETNLYYMNARYYDPATSRFISEDPARDGDSWYMYCGGDPVNCTDPMGYFKVPYAWWSGKKYKKVNDKYWNKYYNNAQLSFSDYIYNQRKEPASKIKMGEYKGSHNGCGWIAVYNAFRLKGWNEHPAIIAALFENQGLNLNGLTGISQKNMSNYLRSYKISYAALSYLETNKMNKRLTSSKVGILFYQWGSIFQCHWIAVAKRGNTVYGYNVFKGEKSRRDIGSVESFLNKNKYKAALLYIF